MRQSKLRLFDDFLPKGTDGNAPAYTGAQYNAQLAKHDMLAIQVVVDDITIGATQRTLHVAIEDSVDGRVWFVRDTLDITLPASSTAMQTRMWGCSGNGSIGANYPLFTFARCNMHFGADDVAGHVQVFATMRN